MNKISSKPRGASIKYWFNFTIAYLLRFKGLILVGLFLGIAIFLITNLIIPRFFSSKTERIGITGRFSPENLPSNILDEIGDGLTTLTPEGVVEPGIAESWETPDKGKTWIFYLKSGQKWQDGSEIKSEDIAYQFSDVVIERPDELTVVFKLNDPFSPFPSVLSRPVFKSGFLGTGDWSVTNVSLVGSYVQNISIKNRQGDIRLYKFYPTEDRTKLAFKLGHVDSIVGIIDPKPLDTWPTATSSEVINKSQIVTLFFNNEDQLFSDNKELRQALDYAINKEKFGERAISPIPPTNWVYNPQVKPYTYNPERAKEILADQKLEDTQIKLVTTPVLLSVAEAVSKDWEAVGVKSIIQISSVIPSDFQAYLAILDVPKDPDQYSIWHSTQKDSTNISKFGNVRIDKLLEDGRIELDVEERRSLYIDFQRFIAEELPAAFLYHPVTYNITRL